MGNTFETEHGIASTEGMEDLVIEGNTFDTTTEGIGLGDGVSNLTIEGNHFTEGGDHVVDYRATPDVDALEAMIGDNTFENEVDVDVNVIRDA